jgi:hypothetical protein
MKNKNTGGCVGVKRHRITIKSYNSGILEKIYVPTKKLVALFLLFFISISLFQFGYAKVEEKFSKVPANAVKDELIVKYKDIRKAGLNGQSKSVLRVDNFVTSEVSARMDSDKANKAGLYNIRVIKLKQGEDLASAYQKFNWIQMLSMFLITQFSRLNILLTIHMPQNNGV